MRAAGRLAERVAADLGDAQHSALFHPCRLGANGGDVLGTRSRIDIARPDRVGGKAVLRLEVERQGMVFGEGVEEAAAPVGEAVEHRRVAQRRQNMAGIAARRAPAGLARLDHRDRYPRFGEVER